MLMTPPRPGMEGLAPSMESSAATGQSRGGRQIPAGRNTTRPDPTARATNVQCPVRSSREARLSERAGQFASCQVVSAVGGNRSSRRSPIASRTRRLASRAVTATVLGAGATAPEVRPPPAAWPRSLAACAQPATATASTTSIHLRMPSPILGCPRNPTDWTPTDERRFPQESGTSTHAGSASSGWARPGCRLLQGHDTDPPVPSNGGAPAVVRGPLEDQLARAWAPPPRRCRCPGRWRPPRWPSGPGTARVGPRAARCRGTGTTRGYGCRTRPGRRW
jgi:hypothetical protein